MKRLPARASAVAALLLGSALVGGVFSAGCGSGTAAVASGGGGGGGNSPSTLLAISVENAATAPATIRFVVSDAESNPARVELFYQAPGQPVRSIAALNGAPNPAVCATSPTGIEHARTWSFTAEPALPADGAFLTGVRVFALIEGGVEATTSSATVGVGNDAPLVTDHFAPSSEVSGVVPLQVTVSDNVSGPVSIRVEYLRAGDDPASGWRPACAAPEDCRGNPPDPAITNVLTGPAGATADFFWDTRQDLAEGDLDVLLRFTPADAWITGAPVETPPFRVDNNTEPRADLDGKALLFDEDERRGIPVPFEVFDAEGDRVTLAFQWRRPGESFPPLPESLAEIQAILADPVARRQLRICSQAPRPLGGRCVPIAPAVVRLPEVAISASALLANGIEGRALEILRATNIPEPASVRWESRSLKQPVDALPLGNGITALVLDRASTGGWRVREIELGTGDVVRDVASGSGSPAAMASEPFSGRVIVAAWDDLGVWSLHRADPGTGRVEVLAFADEVVEHGKPRAVLGIGRSACLLTVGSSIVRIEYGTPSMPSMSTIASGLEVPWGLARDPLEPRQVFVALQGRRQEGVVRLQMDSLELLPLGYVPYPGSSFVDLPHPREIAVDRLGHSLLALCEPEPGRMTLFGLSLGIAGSVYSIRPDIPTTVTGLAVGSENMIILTDPTSEDLWIGGGLEQVRSILSYDPQRREATVDRDFRPPLGANERWRADAGLHNPRGTPAGARGAFLWDSDDAGAGPVFLRISAYDTEQGIGDTMALPKGLKDPFDVVEGPRPADFSGAHELVDVDGDGALDLVGTNYTTVSIWRNVGGEFGQQAATVLSFPIPGAYFLRTSKVVDLDGDDRLDVVTLESSFSDQRTSVWAQFQQPDGSFEVQAVGALPEFVNAALVVGPLGNGPQSDVALVRTGGLVEFVQVAPRVFSTAEMYPIDSFYPATGASSTRLADLDADGKLDLVVSNLGSTPSLDVYLQGAGGFPPEPSWSRPGPYFLRALADVDEDGDLDAVVDTQSSTYLLPNLGNALGAPQPLPRATPLDVDGDGDIDFVSNGGGGGYPLTIWRKSQDGSLTSTTMPDDGSVPILLGGDIDGDGDTDLGFRRQSSPGELDPLGTVLSDPPLASGDLDLDGLIDLLVATPEGLALRFQESPAALSENTVFIEGSLHAYAPLLFDADGDGDLDVVYLVPGSSFPFRPTLAHLVLQTAPRVFLDSGELAPGVRSMSCGDLDHDGDLDLIALVGSGLSVWHQVSPGVYSEVELDLLSPMHTPAYGVHVADMDADGMDDIVTGWNWGSLQFLLQRPGRVFEPITASFFGTGGEYVMANDLDLDGDVDVLSSSASLDFNECISVHGDEWSFVRGGCQFNALAGYRGSSGDLDLDGDQDALGFSLWRQLWPGSFAPTPVLGRGLVDVDGDGELDVLTQGSIRWNGH